MHTYPRAPPTRTGLYIYTVIYVNQQASATVAAAKSFRTYNYCFTDGVGYSANCTGVDLASLITLQWRWTQVGVK
jgi:hypothetical protein